MNFGRRDLLGCPFGSASVICGYIVQLFGGVVVNLKLTITEKGLDVETMNIGQSKGRKLRTEVERSSCWPQAQKL